MFGRELGAVARPFDDELVRSIRQTVQGAIAQEGIVEERQPLVHAAVRGDRETAVAVTSDDQLVQVGALLSVQASQSKVIQDQKVRRQVAAEDLLKRVVGARLAQLSKPLVSAH